MSALRKEAGLPEDAAIKDMFKKKYGMQAGNVLGQASFIPSYTSPDANGLTDNATPFWMVGASGVELEVDMETGRVTLTRLINVADVGTPINPRVVETQLSGAAIMQLGFTLFEEMVLDGGQVINASLADYKIPGMLDLPPMENELVAASQANGPFGAKGLGELNMDPTAAVINNAIFDAVGVRVKTLPITPEKILRALREKS
jgi:CO/xanthine dehydrogenase Mo-binding subunit